MDIKNYAVEINNLVKYILFLFVELFCILLAGTELRRNIPVTDGKELSLTPNRIFRKTPM
jgi:hypothetical protein